jgi:hypothetical protein
MDESENNKEENLDRATVTERAITKLIESKLEPGTLIKAEVFEQLLGISRNSQAFSWLISDIRHALWPHGFHLSGSGFAETGAFEITHPRDNYWLLKLAIARADRDIEGKIVLCSNTRMDMLSELEKRRHENMLRQAQLKLSAMRRLNETSKMFRKKNKQQIDDSEGDLSAA